LTESLMLMILIILLILRRSLNRRSRIRIKIMSISEILRRASLASGWHRFQPVNAST